MNAINETLMSGGVSRDLYGPDLTTLPTLSEQLAVLDAAAEINDAEGYAEVWLTISDANGGGAFAVWWNDDPVDAPARLMVGVSCDEQEEQRRERWQALRDHHDRVDGYREEMERLLVRLGRYTDNRKTSRREIFAVVRAFLATDGEILINPKPLGGRDAIEPKPDTNRFVKGDWTEGHAVAARAMFRLVQRYRARPTVERIARRLGVITGSGWFVLKGRGA